jgi:ribonuclease BN (tRNA processing enzyme)
MKVVLVPSTVGEVAPYQYLTTYLVNDTIAIDAGSIGFYGSPHDQARVRHVFLTHAHIDHIASLAIFLENVFQLISPDCVVVHGLPETLDTVQHDIFNNRVWPDFVKLSELYTPGFLQLAPIQPNRPIEAEGLRLTPVPVNHVVPTVAYRIEGPDGAVVIATDTGPTEAVWELARSTARLKAVLLEATFPDTLAWLAQVSGHFHTQTFLHECEKIPADVPVWAVHLKGRYHGQVTGEIVAAGNPRVHIMAPGREYHF